MALKGNNSIQLEYTPAYKNRYEVSFIDITDGVAVDGNYAKYGATNVTFGDESISFMRNPATTRFTLKEGGAYKRSDTLTITWRESDMYKVKALHKEWISRFYNKDTDKYVSAANSVEAKSRYKIIQIIVPSSTGNGKATRFRFTCLPNNIGNLDLAWGSTAGLTTYSISYYVEDWEMKEVYDEFS